MIFDAHKNFAVSTVAVPPSPAANGVTLELIAGGGALMPAVPFNAVVFPAGLTPTVSNAEIVRVTAIVGDVLTIVRQQEGSLPRTILPGDQFFNVISAKVFTDIETAVNTKQDALTGNVGDMLSFSALNVVQNIPAVALGQVLISQGVGVVPVWSDNVEITALVVPTIDGLTSIAYTDPFLTGNSTKITVSQGIPLTAIRTINFGTNDNDADVFLAGNLTMAAGSNQVASWEADAIGSAVPGTGVFTTLEADDIGSISPGTGTFTTLHATGIVTFDTALTDLNIASAGVWNSKQPGSAILSALAALSYVSLSFVKMTGASTFTLDTNTYITGNQTITLSGDVGGSGTTAITTTIGAGKVTNGMIANATIDLTAKVTGLLPIANGGTATATPALVQGTNITITGTWPNQTINATGGTVNSGTATRVAYYATSGTAVSDSATLTISSTGRLAMQATALGSLVTSYLTITAPADVGMTTGTESIGIFFNAGVVRTWAGSTGFTNQSEFKFIAPTYAFASATGTITNASTVTINAAPTAGTNCNITNPYALRVQAGTSIFEDFLRVKISAMTNPIIVGNTSSATTYGIISFNGAVTTAGLMGLIGGGGSDLSLAYNVATGGTHRFNINNATAVIIRANGIEGALGATTANSAVVTTLACTSLAASGQVTMTVNTASVSTTTGSLVVTGGVGISGALYVGGIVAALTQLGIGAAPTAGTGLDLTSTVSVSSTVAYGARFNQTITAVSNADQLTHLRIQGIYNTAGKTGLSAFGIAVGVPTLAGAGTIDNAYGLWIASPSVGTNNYAIFTTGGLVSFGSTTDASSLTVASTVLAGGLAVAKQVRVGGVVTVDLGTSAGTLPAVIDSNTVMQLGQANSSNPTIEGIAFGGAGTTGLNLAGRAAAGTRGSPTATTGTCLMVRLAAYGYDGSAWAVGGNYEIDGAGTWSGSSRPTQHFWAGTAASSTTKTNWMSLTSTGLTMLNGLGIGVTGALSVGTQSAFGNTSTDYTGQGLALFKGITKAVRFTTASSGAFIEGTDPTGVTSFQPLTMGGSQLYWTINGTQSATMTLGNFTVGNGLAGGAMGINAYDTTTVRDWSWRDDSGVNRLRFARGTSDYWFWDVLKVAASDNVNQQSWRAVSQHDWTVGSTLRAYIDSTGLNVTGVVSATSTFTSTGVYPAAVVNLNNTTASTGKLWSLISYDDGVFYLQQTSPVMTFTQTLAKVVSGVTFQLGSARSAGAAAQGGTIQIKDSSGSTVTLLTT